MFIGIGMQEHLIEVGCLKKKLKRRKKVMREKEPDGN